ncbi:MAG TPA: LacI family DNA-binding transcriptional regulator [Opitutaceae bacterium]|nr:LacI family DNA-binding transcriptional regulator [Opitutaceae bacterium]
MSSVTLSALAKLCGLSPATVSRALSGHPHVRADVRAQVIAAAQSHGYERNQLVSAIMAQVRGTRSQRFVGNLALVHVPSANQPNLRPMQRRILRGAEERAVELGYKTDLFTLEGGEKGQASLARVLQARGVMGVIFLHSKPNPDISAYARCWDYFAIVQIDYDSPTLVRHVVSLDHHFTLVSALSRLRERGYRRIGLFIERHKDERLIYKWSAAFRSFQENQGGIGNIPIHTEVEMSRAGFLAWFEEHHPDLIIGHVDRALAWLKRSGVDTPDQVGFFNLNWNERTRPCAGLDLRPELHGVVAVETLTAQTQRNERGIPLDPRSILINGRWVDGPTLRPTAPAAAA